MNWSGFAWIKVSLSILSAKHKSFGVIFQVQTRSADEPMTTFVFCNQCGNRWKVSLLTYKFYFLDAGLIMSMHDYRDLIQGGSWFSLLLISGMEQGNNLIFELLQANLYFSAASDGH